MKNLDKILGEDMMIAFNYDGVNKKKSFKEYKNLNLAIYGLFQKLNEFEVIKQFSMLQNPLREMVTTRGSILKKYGTHLGCIRIKCSKGNTMLKRKSKQKN